MSGMTRCWRRWCFELALASSCLVGREIASLGDCAIAQIAPDGSLGTESSVVTPLAPGSPVNAIQGGAIRGANLFHSFEKFSVPSGSAAYFNNSLDIHNIISRVTGGEVSNIDGLIQANGTANLFLLNPNGIVFGPNAQLNIGGSFLGSTASSLNFADGTHFSATAPITTPLLTISVPIGLQFRGTAGSILNQSQATNSTGELVGLQVQPGRSLALLGGNMSLDRGNLQAPGGRVELGGVAGAGTVGLQVDGNNLRLSFPVGVPRADVILTNGAGIDVTAGDNGSIAINSRNLDILGGSFLSAGIGEGLGSVDSQAGDITIHATGAIKAGQAGRILNIVESNATGSAGNINITAESVALTDGTQLAASIFGQGNAGNVSVQAREIFFDGVDSNGFSSGAFSSVEEGASGRGGNINVATGALVLANGARLNTSTFGEGDGGNISISADTISLDGVGSNGFRSGIFNNVSLGAVGKGGNIRVTTGSLSVTNGAQIVATTGGQGDAGTVTINAQDSIAFDGVESGGASGAFSSVRREGVGKGGDIRITTGSLSLTNGAELVASTVGKGDAGNVTIDARDTVSFDGVVPNGSISGAVSRVASGAVGNGGDIRITTGSLSLTNGAVLVVSTGGNGDAGSVTINARDTMLVTNDARIVASTFGEGNAGSVTINARDTIAFDGGSAFSTVGRGAVGKGGEISITTESLSLTNGAQLATATRGYGDAGSVNINVRDTVSFDGVNSDGTHSGAFSTVEAGAVGKGGDISITTGSLSATDGAFLTVSTYGQGNAGSVTIDARDTVSFDGRNTSALSAVGEGAEGNAGSMTITTGSLSVTNGAFLSTTTAGQGDAGNVTIDARDSVLLTGSDTGVFSRVRPEAMGSGGNISIITGPLSVTDGAQLAASNIGEGKAGEIGVTASSIRLDKQGSIQATTASGNGGNITLNVQDLLFLRRGSQISTTAGTAATGGDGGNINIHTQFIVAVPKENSDITANAFTGRGGRVEIAAQGIFGLVPRSFEELKNLLRTDDPNQLLPARLPSNDITAISQKDPLLSGQVTLNTPDVDPSQGLVANPAELVDASRLIASSGCGAGGRQGKSEFIVTGRGGLPPNPSDTLSSDTVWTDLRAIANLAENRPSSEEATQQTLIKVGQIVEATRWMTNEKGEVVLTAQAPSATLNIPWMTPASCHTP